VITRHSRAELRCTRWAALVDHPLQAFAETRGETGPGGEDGDQDCVIVVQHTVGIDEGDGGANKETAALVKDAVHTGYE
jgi:hypothetical protein